MMTDAPFKPISTIIHGLNRQNVTHLLHFPELSDWNRKSVSHLTLHAALEFK